MEQIAGVPIRNRAHCGRSFVRMTALLLISLGMLKADRLDTKNYNFALVGGGGGSSAVLDSTINIEIFCNDFNNEIYVPHSNYSANVNPLTQAGFNAATTRFGSMDASGFKPVTINDGDGNDAAEAAAINTADGFARYQMAAYLVSLYNIAGGNNAANNNIQMAIWEILDPMGYPSPTSINGSANPTDALETAADWFLGTSEASREFYLSDFRILSDTAMTCTKLVTGACAPDTPLTGGFQEQITILPTPEPASYVLFGSVLLGIGWAARRSRRPQQGK